MSLINCEVELILIWSANCVVVANQVPTFTITDTNLYVPVVTLSTQDNAKLLPQLKSGFKRTISWNKYLSKPALLARNANLNHLIEPSFEGVNRLFVLAFEDDDQRISNKRYHCRTDCFKYSFFPSALRDWFKLDEAIRNSESISIFKNKLLSFIRPVQNSIHNIVDQKGIKLLTCLRLDFSHLNEHRFRHNFENCLNPLCSCSLEIENTVHYLLHCHHFSTFRIDLMNSVKSVYNNFESLSDNAKKDVLLYGDPFLDQNKNKFILEATIDYIKISERFSESLFE